MSDAPDDIRRFLEALWPKPVPLGKLTLWTAPDKKTRTGSPESYAVAAARALELASRFDVYIGCGLRRPGLPPGSRGKKADVIALPAVWADVDLDDEAAARAALAAFPLRPSALVWSGHGLHAWWLFDAPWLLGADTEKTAADRFVKAFGRSLAGEHVDPSVFELARVMRLPGTWNRKRDPAVPVRLLVLEPTRRYTREQLAAHFKPEPERRNGRGPTATVRPDGGSTAYVRAALADELKTLSNAGEGERNDALNKAAFALGQLVGGGALEQAEAEATLERGAGENGLWEDDGPDQCRATIAS